MKAHSKNLLMGKKGKKYKAYLLTGNNYIDIKDLGITEKVDIEKPFGVNSDSSFILLNGKLYYYDKTSLSQASNKDTWALIEDNLAIADDGLYSVSDSSNTITKISTLTDWNDISGSYYDVSGGGTGTVSGSGFGIRNEKLYYINNQNIATVNSLDYISVSGYYYYRYLEMTNWSSWLALAIRKSGQLDAVTSGSYSQLSGLSNCTKVSGVPYVSRSNYSYSYKYAYCIANRTLYVIAMGLDRTAAASKISDLTSWTDISGASTSDNQYAYGIANGQLYSLKYNTVSKISDLTSWTDISGASTSSNQYAYGIADGQLYSLQNNTVTLINLPVSKCLYICGESSSSTYSTKRALAICEE